MSAGVNNLLAELGGLRSGSSRVRRTPHHPPHPVGAYPPLPHCLVLPRGEKGKRGGNSLKISEGDGCFIPNIWSGNHNRAQLPGGLPVQRDAGMKKNVLDFTENVGNKSSPPPHPHGCKVHSCDGKITSQTFSLPMSGKTMSRMSFNLQQRKDDEVERRAPKSLTGCPP